MINLSSVMQAAQGGQGIDNLAARFGLTPEQAQNAVNALLPAVQMGLQNRIEAGGIGSVLGPLAGGVGKDAYNDPAAAQSSATAAHGSTVLGELFGGSQTQVAQQVAAESGVPASIIQAMLPVVVSMIMGGLMHGAQNGAFGGILSGVLGSLLGSGHGTASAPPAPGQGDVLGGTLGSVLGGLFGGHGSAIPQPPTREPDAEAPEPAPSSADATLDEISGMFKAGTTTSPGHEAQLASLLGR